MKHSDFLRSLKTLKSQLNQNKSKTYALHTITDEPNEEKTFCSCKDALGDPKYLYTSKKEINTILSSTNITLHVYPCPYEKGWHLTKS